MIIDWYYHIYIVTNKKILEVNYAPLFSHEINEVLLEQVRCTEIDIRAHGILSQLLDTGDVVLTFDRPTHQEELALTYIKNPKELGVLLSGYLNISIDAPYSPVLYGQKNDKKLFAFSTQIFPRRSFEL